MTTTIFYLFGIFYILDLGYLLINRVIRIRTKTDDKIIHVEATDLKKHFSFSLVLSLVKTIWVIIGLLFAPERWFFLLLMLISILPFLASLPKGNNFDYIKKGYWITMITRIGIVAFIVYSHFYLTN